jgi:predicted HTH transcriptional regulator
MCAMANIGPNSTGYVLLGVADKASDGNRISCLDGTDTSTVRGFHVVGIEREAIVRRVSLNDYWTWILQRISTNSAVPAWLGTGVSREARLANYRGAAVGILKVRPATEPAFYSGELFERVGSETKRVPQGSQAMVGIIQRFA